MIATIVDQIKKKVKSIVVTGDMDLLQIVNEYTEVMLYEKVL